MVTLALSRTCYFPDFPGCVSVASWQQQLADAAWARWVEVQTLAITEGGLVVNFTTGAFLAPGLAAVYCTHDPLCDDRLGCVPAVYGLGVLDRSEAPVKFLSEAGRVLQPQGLLVLTFAYWDAEGPDTALGHEARKRIYSAHSYQRLIRDARRVGFENFGGLDWTYHGDVLVDHSLASLVLRKREET